MSRTTFSLVVLIMATGTGLTVDKVAFEQVDVFVAGERDYKEFRIPVLVVTNSGTLLAISEAGRTSSDSGDRDLLLRRSTDGGRTWSADIQLLRDEGASTCGNPTVLVDRQTGRIHLLSTVNGARVFHNYSDDDGVTWSDFRDITEVFEAFKPRFAWTRFATGPGLGIELARGKYKGRFVMTLWFTSDEKQFRSAVVYSDDRGKTWKPGGLTDEAFNTNECTVFERADGTLVLNMRGGGNHPKEGRKPYRITAISSDGGMTWSKSQYDKNLICPECLACTRRHSWPEEERSRVLFANPADEKGRVNMTVRLSYDEGVSWPVAKQIFAGPSAYSCLARLPDGDIGLLFEGGERHRYQKMILARFPLAWLTDAKDGLNMAVRPKTESPESERD
jgi:sialidase-1